MMRSVKALYIILLSLCAAITGSAKEKENTYNKSLLWRISRVDMKKPSYLFGTIHLICPADYVWTTRMKESLKKSDEVCFEMDMDDPAVMLKVATGLMDNSGKTLKDYFSPEQYSSLEAYMRDSLNMNITMFQVMKPVALQSLFTTKSVSCTSPVSYEDRIMDEAKKNKKQIIGLEQPEEQIALFNDMPADSVVKGIMESIGSQKDDRAQYQQMVNAYKGQDLPALYDLITKSKELGDDMGAFLDDRNRKWIERMVDKMDQKSIFFAVGAGHLWGETGVINLLRKEGYVVEPLK